MDPPQQDYLDGLQIIHEIGGVSRLCGTLPDQPTLYGVFKKLAHFSLTLFSFESDEGVVSGKFEV